MMQNRRKYSLLIIFILNQISVGLFAQSTSIDSTKDDYEQIYVITDRDVYCVGEIVHLKIFNQNEIQGSNANWSKIVYSEIITPDGRSVVKEKLLFTKNCADGDLIIPRDALSGNYYIRTYTKWMKNRSPYSFNYKPIKIINPVTVEVIANLVSTNENLKVENIEMMKPGFISIKKQDSTYHRDEMIQIYLNTNCKDCFQNNLSLSVVKKGTNHSRFLQIDAYDRIVNEIKFIPETRGVSLTGKVVNKLDSIPVPYANVWITLLTQEPVTREVLTDSSGNFYIDLGTEIGKYDLFIQASTTRTNIEPVVCVDNDFSYSKMNLPFIPFEVTVSDIELYESLIVNSQLKNIYMAKKTAPDSMILSFDKSFYGKPDFVLNVDNFIELPTVEDYIRELLPNIRIKKEGSKRYFKLYGSNPEMAFYDPLVMVNQIKFNDAENILELSPKQIDRVELIEVPYLRGEMIYGGIIHFITHSTDYSKINFPDGSIFVEYDMLGENESLNNNENKPVIPTIGNCLNWNPSLILNNKEDTVIRFNTGSEIGEYEIIVEGLDKYNKPFQVRDSFTVK